MQAPLLLCVVYTPIASVPTDNPRVRELLAALESLYDDEMLPRDRVLKMRLEEMASARKKSRCVDLRDLKEACEACPWTWVQTHDGFWTAFLRYRVGHFVDAYSREDTYPHELWSGLSAYLARLKEPNVPFPISRYRCAQILIARNLPFLQGLSLGQVCHIVQLALSKHKLLGYSRNGIVPYAQSLSRAKEERALMHLTCDGEKLAAPLASWSFLRAGLSELLAEAGDGGISISLLKFLFRSRFEMTLSETALGCAKLSQLLQADCLADVCSLHLTEQGYVLRRRSGKSIKPTGLCLVSTPNHRSRADEPELSKSHFLLVKNTFLHFVSPSPLRPRAKTG